MSIPKCKISIPRHALKALPDYHLNALALDCGLSHNTARSWLSVLETSGIVYLLKARYSQDRDPELASGLEAWMRYSGAEAADCSLVYAGDRGLEWKGLSLVPWAAVGATIAPGHR
jgi:hypothetical protein